MHADDMPSAADGRATPDRIAVADADHLVTITWADGHVSRYPFWYLRGLCPCATCQGHGGDKTFVGEEAGLGPALNTVAEVGHYAINFTWHDGHKTGIYTLDTLRTMCPCPACRVTPTGKALWELLPEGRKQALTAMSNA
jgi:prepilin-type processing-associated H-X9-DG protein